MIDLHCHLLPGIDDGPDTLEEALELCRIAAADGIRRAVVTPHIHPGRWDNVRHDIRLRCEALATVLREESVDLQLGYASEVRLSDALMQQVRGDEIAFYGALDGYQILLLEFPHGHLVPGSDKLARWLLERGIRPLIAHPERNRQLMREPELLLPFLEMGCWLQLTGGSLLGDFGDRAAALAWQLIDDGAVTVVASDGHNSRVRRPVLSRAFDALAARKGAAMAARLLCDNPASISADQWRDELAIPA